jgi:MFS superfamily sulfate permease-like transporter
VTATAIAQALGMPVRYVSLPDNLFGAIQLPAAASFLRAFQPEFLLAAVTLAFVASAETLLSASAVDQMHDGPRTNYDKEMRSQGVGNILSGLAGGLPMTGVIVRSATNVAAGAKTRRSAMMHGLWLLILVAALPGVLRLVPTSSLAAILVYTGYKLINPANVRRLISYGGAPVLIYAVTVVMIVCADLLTGIIAGIALSLVKILWALSSLTIETRTSEANRVDLFISGAATFLRMPKLVDTLNALPVSSEVHVHFQNMQYIDHASMEAITSWEQQRASKDGKTVVEWEELKDRYKLRNRFGPLGTGNLDLARGSASAH